MQSTSCAGDRQCINPIKKFYRFKNASFVLAYSILSSFPHTINVGEIILDILPLNALQQENVSVSSVKIEEIKESLNEQAKEMANTKPPKWTISIERTTELISL
jgi:hypothetical protein